MNNPEDNEQTSAPTFSGYTEDGVQGYFVDIYPTEPSTIYYRILHPVSDSEWSEWMEYTSTLLFTDEGWYRVEAYAVAPDKDSSITIAYEFVVQPQTLSPEFTVYTVDGEQGTYVEITEREPDCTIYYNVQYPSGQWTYWMEYSETMLFTSVGTYHIDAYAVVEGKFQSEVVSCDFDVLEVTYAPTFSGYSEDGVVGYNVEIFESEPSTVYYRVMHNYPDGEWTHWMEYTEMLTFTEPGLYRMEAYAAALDKTPSMTIAYEFIVQEQTMAPTFSISTDYGYRYYVNIRESESDCTIYYNVQYPNGNWSDWKRYTGTLTFTAAGDYHIDAYAIAQGKIRSEVVSFDFTIEERTSAPTFSGYTEDGVQGYFVDIFPTEPSTIYYRILHPDFDSEWSEWMEYTSTLLFTDDGWYRVEAYAVAPDKDSSMTIAYEFVVRPITQPGDVNGDGSIDIADVTTLIDIILYKMTPTDGCDVNLDGEVTIADVTDLIDYILSL